MKEVRNWTRACPNYKQALLSTAERIGVTPKEVEAIVLKYLYRCKQLIMQGHGVQLPGIINIRTFYWQLKKMRKFMSYAQMKKRYGDKEYFKKFISKTK